MRDEVVAWLLSCWNERTVRKGHTGIGCLGSDPGRI